jgi:hypothetical protein
MEEEMVARNRAQEALCPRDLKVARQSFLSGFQSSESQTSSLILIQQTDKELLQVELGQNPALDQY